MKKEKVAPASAFDILLYKSGIDAKTAHIPQSYISLRKSVVRSMYFARMACVLDNDSFASNVFAPSSFILLHYVRSKEFGRLFKTAYGEIQESCIKMSRVDAMLDVYNQLGAIEEHFSSRIVRHDVPLSARHVWEVPPEQMIELCAKVLALAVFLTQIVFSNE